MAVRALVWGVLQLDPFLFPVDPFLHFAVGADLFRMVPATSERAAPLAVAVSAACCVLKEYSKLHQNIMEHLSINRGDPAVLQAIRYCSSFSGRSTMPNPGSVRGEM